MSKTIKTIRDLVPDDKNANRGTQRGTGFLESSLEKYGAGRSILADKNGRIIAGNKTVEGAASIGLEDVVVVKTDGTKLVIVQREDLDLDDPKARELAIADNRVAQVNLDWDADVLAQLADEGVQLDEFWSEDEITALLDDSQVESEGGGLRDEYSPNVGEVVYEPKETNHKPQDLFNISDAERFETDIAGIKNKDIQKLLRARAAFFTSFNFSKIADYYAYQASDEEKDLFEKMALVLLDRDQLIANGFAAMIDEVQRENGFVENEEGEERE